MLKAQHKAAEDERHTAAKELSDRMLKVGRLTNKYEIICGRMGSDAGNGDGEHTQARRGTLKKPSMGTNMTSLSQGAHLTACSAEELVRSLGALAPP